MLSFPSPFGWLETCETVILLSNIAQVTKIFNLVEVADSHRGKVNLIERAGGCARGDDWGLLKEFFLLQNTLNILKYLKVVFFEKIPHVVPSKADTGEHQLK